MPKISIIVPVYNVQNYIEKCLVSLVNQTMKDIEIIIIDDGSPDDSYKIYEKFAAEDHRIRIIKKRNGGVSEARNTGIEAATGDFLLFIDSDDWMELNGCEALYQEQIRTGADLILADVIVITDGVAKKNNIFSRPFTTTDRDFIRKYQKACIGYCYNPMPAVKWNIPGLGSPWNKLFKREIIQRWQMRFDSFVKGIYDDNLFTLHYLMYTESLSYIKTPVYDFRIVSDSITQTYKANTLDINARIFQRIEEFMDENDTRSDFTEAFYVYIIRRFSKSLNVYFFSKKNKARLSVKLVELKRVMQSEPYKTAIRNVDDKLLLFNHRVVCVLARTNMPELLWVILSLKRMLHR